MKILTGIDIPFVPYGGSPIICNDWYSDLPNGIDVKFVTFPPCDPYYTNWWSIRNVEFLSIEKKNSQDKFYEYIQMLKVALRKVIESYRPDIIHCQHLNFGLSRAIAELKSNIPLIGICHGTDVQLARSSPFFLHNMQIIRKAMDVLVFPAQKMADNYFKVDPVKKKHVIIPHGIPDDAFKKRTKSFSHDKLKILYAGRLNSYKGVDIVVKAMKLLRNDAIQLTVIGKADEAGITEKLQALVLNNHLDDTITFSGQVPRKTLWNFMDSFDVMVFPSRSLEAFGITTIEAQARGLPIMIAKGGGIENAVSSTAMIVPRNTPDVWALQLRKILKHPSLLNEFQQRGYSNAENHRISRLREQYFTLSRSLLKEYFRSYLKK